MNIYKFNNYINEEYFNNICEEYKDIDKIYIESTSMSYELERKQIQISGGKYGTSCFLKYCGPQELRHKSLGELNSYVQKLLDLDIIR